MSSPGTVHAPRVRQRSFAGPIILIAIGILFLLGNMHVITWDRLGWWFATWWPVLLIAYGLLKLVEYYAARRDGTQFRGLGAGGVILVIFVILVGLTATGLRRVNWSELQNQSGWQGDFGDFWGKQYVYTQVIEQDFPSGDSLKITSAHGDVTVTPWDQNKIKIEVNKTVRAESQSAADRLNEQSQPVTMLAANEVVVNANNENKAAVTNLQIYVPRKSGLTISTAHGDVVVHGRDGSVKVDNSHGDVNVEDVTGNADINMRHGSLHAANVSGNLSVDGRLDDVNVADVTGSVQLTGDYFGDLNVSNVARGVNFKSSRTDLQFAKLNGKLNMQSDSLNADALSGPVRISTRAKDINLENVSGEVQVTNSNANVQLRSADKLPLGQISIVNRNGSVELTLPAKASFRLEAIAEKGEIQSDFGLNKNAQNGDSTANGQIGQGGPKIQINSQHGSVSIRKAT
jgi:DUF4097 and DUF4098 domain-containing protein YvlB